ncbi:MAG: DNA polymerase III subunit gamma/tau C-terminal domain-containing protein, partial [Methylococcaceae bacterium]|nr:DNA polymerase III subunit gamma/tau C-terminal domain-containing protein [Methylococcaceae bacterium]
GEGVENLKSTVLRLSPGPSGDSTREEIEPSPSSLGLSPPWEEPPAGQVLPSTLVEQASEPPALVEEKPAQAVELDWSGLIKQMRLSGMTLQLANHCVLVAIEENRVVLALDPQAATFRRPQLEERLEKALQSLLKRPLKLVIHDEAPKQDTPAVQIQRHQAERQKAAEQEIEQDPIVLALKERFDARIVPGSIKPLD